MAETADSLLLRADEDQLPQETLWERFMEWVRNELVWYAGSFSFHLLGLSLLLLLPNFGGGHDQDDGPLLVSSANQEEKKEPEKFENVAIGDLENIQPVDFSFDPTQRPLGQDTQDTGNRDDNPVPAGEGGSTPGSVPYAKSKGIGAFEFGPGPALARVAGNAGNIPGNGGKGFIDIRRGQVKPGTGGTIPTQRAVTAALVWLANHQLYDGSWSLQNFASRCKDKSCTGRGEVPADAGATAMALLTYLATGETHKSNGHFREHIHKGIDWLIRHQQPDGNLAKGAAQMMYSHGLATIALSEAYGLSGDRQVGMAAQGAVNFILNAQNTADGGWRYNPKDPGDTSVVGWQLMALKSAHMAGLSVGGSVFSGTSKWLDSVAVHDGAEYAYQPGQGPSSTMTSVGLLCRQYMGAKRNDPMLGGGMSYLLNHLPDDNFSNIYYWYYATQVMHNMSGYEWDTWNRKMRELLVRTQVRNVDQCANGSWSPENDAWGKRGGRVMQTALSCLTLEIYYRYLPLFKTEAGAR